MSVFFTCLGLLLGEGMPACQGSVEVVAEGGESFCGGGCVVEDVVDRVEDGHLNAV